MHTNELQSLADRGSVDNLPTYQGTDLKTAGSGTTFRCRAVQMPRGISLLGTNRTRQILLIIEFASFSLLLASCSSESFVDLASPKSSLNLEHFPGRKQYPDDDALLLSNTHNVQAMLDRDGDVETN